jgi:hypothetical protein
MCESNMSQRGQATKLQMLDVTVLI